MKSACFSGCTTRTAGIYRFLVRQGRNIGRNRFNILDAVARATFDTEAAFDAFITINYRQAAISVFVQSDSLGGTAFNAKTAAYAGETAVRHCRLAFSAIVAFYVNFGTGIS